MWNNFGWLRSILCAVIFSGLTACAAEFAQKGQNPLDNQPTQPENNNPDLHYQIARDIGAEAVSAGKFSTPNFKVSKISIGGPYNRIKGTTPANKVKGGLGDASL